MTALRDSFEVTHKKPLKNKAGQTIAELDYISWSQAADRLDDVVGDWSFAIIGVGEDWAHGRLTFEHQGVTRHFENIGYAENADQEWKKEALKDAASDAFKRCAALAGVGRYLYDKDAPARQERPVTPAPTQRPRVVPDDDTGGEANPFDDPASTAPIARPAEDRCPWHPDRTPKEGRYGLYCTGQGGNGPLNGKGYCNWKPAA